MSKLTPIRFLFALAIMSCLVLPQLATAQDKEIDDETKEKIAELIQDARSSLGNEDWADAAETLAKVVKLDPKNALGWQLHGYALHADGKLDAAINSHKKAAEFDQTKGIALYNLGCAYALKKDNKTAMDYLDKSIDAGFVTLSYFETDTDLDGIRKEDRFKKIVEVVKKGGRESKFDTKPLIGKWKIKSGTRSGEDIDNSRLPPEITITATTFTIPAGDDKFVMAYKVVGTKKPISINFEIKEGPVPEGKAVGIIKIEKNKVTLCYDSTGQKRPTEFKTVEDDQCFMFVMERIEEKKDAKGDAKK